MYDHYIIEGPQSGGISLWLAGVADAQPALQVRLDNQSEPLPHDSTILGACYIDLWKRLPCPRTAFSKERKLVQLPNTSLVDWLGRSLNRLGIVIEPELFTPQSRLTLQPNGAQRSIYGQ